MRIPFLVIGIVGVASASTSFPSLVSVRRPFAAFATTPGTAVSSEVVEKSKARVLSLARQIKADSKTGVFIADPDDRADLKSAVADLEAICAPPSERSRQLMIGDWTLLCTTSSPTGGRKEKKKGPKLPFKLPDIPLQDKINKSIEVTQRIRALENEDGKGASGSITTSTTNDINRVDNIIQYTPFAETLGDVFGENTPFSSLKVNPLEVSKSKVTLIHNAEVQSISPVLRTKIALKSVVLTVAGTSQYLEPDGADLLGLNVPLGEFTNSGNFDTTYVDENIRISRGNIGFVDVLRVFVRKGIDAETDEVVEGVEVSRSKENDEPSDLEKRIEEVSGAIVDVVETVDKIRDDVSDTIKSDLEAVRDSVDGVADAVKDASEDVRGVIEEDMKDVRKAVEGVADAVVGKEVREAVEDTFGSVSDTVDDITEAVKDASEDVRGVVEDDMKDVRKSVEGVADAVVGKEVREAVEDTIEENLDNIQKAVDSVRGESKEEEEGEKIPGEDSSAGGNENEDEPKSDDKFNPDI